MASKLTLNRFLAIAGGVAVVSAVTGPRPAGPASAVFFYACCVVGGALLLFSGYRELAAKKSPPPQKDQWAELRGSNKRPGEGPRW